MTIANIRVRYKGKTRHESFMTGRAKADDGRVIHEGWTEYAWIRHGETYNAELFVHEKYVGVKIRIPGTDCCYAFMGELREPNGIQQIEFFDVDFD